MIPTIKSSELESFSSGCRETAEELIKLSNQGYDCLLIPCRGAFPVLIGVIEALKLVDSRRDLLHRLFAPYPYPILREFHRRSGDFKLLILPFTAHVNIRNDYRKEYDFKASIDSYGLESMHKGLSIAKEIGLLNRYPHIDGFIPPKLGDPPNLLYSGLIKTIIAQMVSYTVARKMISRFVRAFGKTVTYKGNVFHTFPEPEIVYESSEKVIKEKATVSMAKAIREVAKLELENMLKDIEAIAWKNPHEAARELMKIKGICYWTAYVSLMACLGIWHAQPIDRLITSLNKAGISDKSVFEESPSAAGYISVAILFGEALRGRYFSVDKCDGT